MLSNGDLLSHLSWLMFLHYLRKHKHEPLKLRIFSHAVFPVSKTTLLWLAVTLTFINQFLIIFTDNKVTAFYYVQCANIISCLAVLFSRHIIQHNWKDTVFEVYVSPGSAETLVRRIGIPNHRLIAYSLSSISAKSRQNWLISIEVIVCYTSVVFKHCVYCICFCAVGCTGLMICVVCCSV